MQDLKKRTYEFSLKIIRFLESLPKDYLSMTMAKQLLRSGTSVGANVVEAYAASSRKDFANFYNHALKSANESIYWLNLLSDSGKAPEASVASVLVEAGELSKILAASLLTLRRRKTG